MQVKPGFKLVISFVMLACSWSFSAAADDSSNSSAPESRTTIEGVTDQKNKTPGGDIDDTITNNYMRALSGSKSRVSIASQFNYVGGTISNPFGAQRPNIAAGAAVPTAAMLQGQVSGKYNIDAQSSLMAGTGLDWVTPFQGSYTPSSYNRKVDVFNPYAIYQYMYKWAGVQSVAQFQPTWFTQTSSVQTGYELNLQLSQNNIYQLGHSNWSLGLFTAVYSNPYFTNSGMQTFGGHSINVATTQADYGLSVDPFLEYQINDALNFRTVFNFWNYDHWKADPNDPADKASKAEMVREPWIQSVGVGIRVTRDIFLYPNVQFLPEQLRSDLTNFALYTVINVF